MLFPLEIKQTKNFLGFTDIRMRNYIILITFKMHQIVDLSYTTQRKCYCKNIVEVITNLQVYSLS
jgi:hypothetical protein